MTQIETKIEVVSTEKSENEIENGNQIPSVSLNDQTVEEKIVKQVEFYFGDVNLPHDRFIKLESANHDGWFPAELLLKFNKLNGIVSSVPENDKLKKILEALQSSILVEVHEDSTKVRRNLEMPVPEGNAESKTVYLKGFNKTETKLEQLIEFFKKYEGMEAVIMRYYKEKILLPQTSTKVPAAEKCETTVESKSEDGANEEKECEKPQLTPVSKLPTADKVVWVKKFKGSIFVVFKTEELGKAALADVSTYAGHPLMKLMQADYLAMKKKEFQTRQEQRMAKKRKSEGKDETSAKLAKGDDEEKKGEEGSDQTLKGVLVKISEIPAGTTRELIKERWYIATEDKDKFEIGFVDFQRGDKDGVLRLSNEGAATEALALESLKEGKLPLNDGASIKLALFPSDEEEREYNLKMQKDRLNFKNRGGGRGRGGRDRGRAGGRGRGARGRGGRRH